MLNDMQTFWLHSIAIDWQSLGPHQHVFCCGWCHCLLTTNEQLIAFFFKAACQNTHTCTLIFLHESDPCAKANREGNVLISNSGTLINSFESNSIKINISQIVSCAWRVIYLNGKIPNDFWDKNVTIINLYICGFKDDDLEHACFFPQATRVVFIHRNKKKRKKRRFNQQWQLALISRF